MLVSEINTVLLWFTVISMTNYWHVQPACILMGFICGTYYISPLFNTLVSYLIISDSYLLYRTYVQMRRFKEVKNEQLNMPNGFLSIMLPHRSSWMFKRVQSVETWDCLIKTRKALIEASQGAFDLPTFIINQEN